MGSSMDGSLVPTSVLVLDSYMLVLPTFQFPLCMHLVGIVTVTLL